MTSDSDDLIVALAELGENRDALEALELIDTKTEGYGIRQIHEVKGWPVATVSHKIRPLEEHQLVERKNQGRKKPWVITERGIKLLQLRETLRDKAQDAVRELLKIRMIRRGEDEENEDIEQFFWKFITDHLIERNRKLREELVNVKKTTGELLDKIRTMSYEEANMKCSNCGKPLYTRSPASPPTPAN